MTLTDYLRKHRLTHAEFGARIGASQAAVTRYANGRRKPSLGKLVAIERATRGAVRPIDFIPTAPANTDPTPAETAGAAA